MWHCVTMPKRIGGKPQVRLDKDNIRKLQLVQKDCSWPVSLAVLANYVIRHGFRATQQTFNWRRPEPKKQEGR